MSRQLLDVVLAGAAIAAAAGTPLRCAASAQYAAAAAQRTPAPSAALALDDWQDLDDHVEMTVNNDPFRLSNAPPVEGLMPVAQSGAPSTPTPPVRPQFQLQGIAGGPPWRAMVAGFPGQGPVLVESGSVVGSFTVSRVSADRVVIKGADTSWALALGGTP